MSPSNSFHILGYSPSLVDKICCSGNFGSVERGITIRRTIDPGECT